MSATSYKLARDEVRTVSGLWWVAVLLGLLSLAAGVIIIIKPENSLKTLAVIAGIFILLDGLLQFVIAFGPGTSNRAFVALIGTLDLVIGILLIRHPVGGVKFVALLLGIWLVVAGVIRIVLAFETEGARLGRIVVGALELIFGVVIVASPNIGFATLAILAGLAFIVNGLASIALGIMMRSLRNAADELPEELPDSAVG